MRRGAWRFVAEMTSHAGKDQADEREEVRRPLEIAEQVLCGGVALVLLSVNVQLPHALQILGQ